MSGQISLSDAKRWRGRIEVPTRAHPLVRRLYEEINAQQTTIKDVHVRAGVSRHSLWNWRYNTQPKISDIIACLNVLELDVYVGPAGLNQHDVMRGLAAAKRAKEAPQDGPAGQVQVRKEGSDAG